MPSIASMFDQVLLFAMMILMAQSSTVMSQALKARLDKKTDRWKRLRLDGRSVENSRTQDQIS